MVLISCLSNERSIYTYIQDITLACCSDISCYWPWLVHGHDHLVWRRRDDDQIPIVSIPSLRLSDPRILRRAQNRCVHPLPASTLHAPTHTCFSFAFLKECAHTSTDDGNEPPRTRTRARPDGHMDIGPAAWHSIYGHVQLSRDSRKVTKSRNAHTR